MTLAAVGPLTNLAGQTIQAAPGAHCPAADWHGVPAQSVCVAVDADRWRAELRARFVN